METFHSTDLPDFEDLKSILDESSFGFWIWKYEVDTLYLSEKIKSQLSLPSHSESYKIADFWACIHDEDLSALQTIIKSNHSNGIKIDTEFRISNSKETNVRWMRLQCSTLNGKNASENKLAGTLTDITEAITAKQNLEQKNAELRFIFDNVPAQIWLKDSKNRILRLNEKAANSMGVTVDAAEGADTFALFPEMAVKYYEDDLKVINSGVPLRGLIEEYIPLNAKRGWVSTDKFPYYDPITEKQTLLVMSTDITELKRIETQLRKSKDALRQANEDLEKSHERFVLATKGSSVGIWEWPIQGQTPVFWSPVYYDLLGYDDKEIVASYDAYRASVHPEDEDTFFTELERCIDEQEKLRIETRLRHKSGTYKWFLVSGEGEWAEDGTPLRMIGSIMDIDDLKEAQIKTEEYSLRLEIANRELENFAYVASHDLKAPLRSMDNLAVWIGEDLGDTLTDDIAEKLAYLRARILRLEDMLKDILAFSYADKNLSEPEELDLEDLIDEVVLWVSPLRKFTVQKKLSVSKIFMVRTMMEQIILNLLSNAIKHNTQEQGVAIIEAFETDDTVRLIVTDNGPGIAEKYHDYVFELFKTLKPRDKVAGSGIGLSIVKKMLETIGGTIWIEIPDDKKGVAFHIKLPKNFHLHK